MYICTCTHLNELAKNDKYDTIICLSVMSWWVKLFIVKHHIFNQMLGVII